MQALRLRDIPARTNSRRAGTRTNVPGPRRQDRIVSRHEKEADKILQRKPPESSAAPQIERETFEKSGRRKAVDSVYSGAGI